MKPSGLLGIAAALLWGGSLWPGRTSGDAWLLADRSASMGDAPVPAEWLERVPESRRFQFATELRPWDGSVGGRNGSRLGAALTELAGRLAEGDELLVFSDGRATDDLPPLAPWRGRDLRWLVPPPRPRIVGADCPASWPGSGATRITVHLADADLETGTLEVRARPVALAAADWRPDGPDRLAVTLRTAAAPAEGLELLLTWRQEGTLSSLRRWIAAPGRIAAAVGGGSDAVLEDGVRNRPMLDLRLLPAEAAVVVERAQSVDLAALQRWLDEGKLVLLLGERFDGWLRLPSTLRPFDARPPAEAALHLLLDRSGSMASGALDEARKAIADWAEAWPATARFVVHPFAAQLEAPLRPDREEGRHRLAELRPFGPTELAAAVEELLPRLAASDRVVILSDGRAPAPAAGWPAQGAALLAACSAVITVPVGGGADAEVLASLGELARDGTGEDLAQRLRRGLADADDSADGPAIPAAGTLWTLPARLAWPRRSRMDARPGAERLLVDGEGNVAAAALRVGSGVLLGAAVPAEGDWPPLLEAVAADWTALRVRRAGDFLVWEGNDPGGARAGELPASGARRLQPFDPWSGQEWRAGPFDPATDWQLELSGGASLRLPAPPRDEGSSSAEPWRRWLAARAAVPPTRRFASVWLLAALLAALTAAGLRHRGL